jgi:predicted short-subunit dehydrogenase-like oxidoreductase (DUF2520 family)
MATKEKIISKKILIVGAGNVGTSLFRALNERFPGKIHLFGNKDYSRQNSTYLHEDDYTNYLNPGIVNTVETIIVCVGDDHIKEATQSILPFELVGKFVFHTSGAKSTSELDHLKNKGAHLASIHPMQSFANTYSEPKKWHDIILTFQGDKKCYPAAQEIAENLQAKMICLDEEQKTGLHVAGVMAANYLVALLSAAENILALAGIDNISKNDILQPLVQGVVDNYKKAPADQILSGPIKRGDINVLKQHIQYLKSHKSQDADLYTTLAKVLLNNPKFEIPNRTKMLEILENHS